MQQMAINSLILLTTLYLIILILSYAVDKIKQTVMDVQLQKLLLKKLDTQSAEDIMKLIGGKK